MKNFQLDCPVSSRGAWISTGCDLQDRKARRFEKQGVID